MDDKMMTEVEKSYMKVHDVQTEDSGSLKVKEGFTAETCTGEDEQQSINLDIGDTSGDVNMEAVITTDDVTRAGGFSATDDIGSLLPVAMDSTDLEASLRHACEFEGPQQEMPRPGLGWTEPTKSDTNLLAS